MLSMRLAIYATAISALFLIPSEPASAACRQITMQEEVKISEDALKDLAPLGLGQAEIMHIIRATALPEASGCWSSATGNFDKELVSVGAAQWNFGQQTLQKLLLAFRTKFGAEFPDQLATLMPNYGKLVFSAGCLKRSVTAECKEKILALQSSGGKLDKGFAEELNALFESDVMIQIQTDEFVRLITSVKSGLTELFGDKITPRQVKWAIDTRVQQGTSPKANENVQRIRKRLNVCDRAQQLAKVASIITWYEGLASSIDQDGVRWDWEWNVKKWRDLLAKSAISGEQIDLLHLSFLRSRTAEKFSGLYQALTFQRRARIILDVGSVAGHRVDIGDLGIAMQ